MEDAERHLFVTLADGGQVVRYSDGEWWVEYPHATLMPGRRIKVDSAVHMALREGSVVVPDAPGGMVFYRRLNEARNIQGE
jgi:hypothetical protein